jgi:hypothetical protein
MARATLNDRSRLAAAPARLESAPTRRYSFETLTAFGPLGPASSS